MFLNRTHFRTDEKAIYNASCLLAEGRFATVLQVCCVLGALTHLVVQVESTDPQSGQLVKTAVKLFKLSQPQDVDGELSIWEHLLNVPGVQPFLGVLTTRLAEYYTKAALMPFRVSLACT